MKRDPVRTVKNLVTGDKVIEAGNQTGRVWLVIATTYGRATLMQTQEIQDHPEREEGKDRMKNHHEWDRVVDAPSTNLCRTCGQPPVKRTSGPKVES